MKITVYKVKAGGSVKYVDKTREGALLWATTSLKEIWGDIPYRILSETLDVPETTGVIWSDKETAHVDWSCPHCGESHFTDLDTDESPALWLCETGNKDDLCLVYFDERALHIGGSRDMGVHNPTDTGQKYGDSGFCVCGSLSHAK